MFSNRISGFFPSPAVAVATAPLSTGFAACPLMAPQPLLLQLVAQQLALRELISAAERRGAERAIAASLRSTN